MLHETPELGISMLEDFFFLQNYSEYNVSVLHPSCVPGKVSILASKVEKEK